MAKIFPRFKDGDNLEPRHINWIFSELERWRHASATPPLVFADTDGDDPPTIEFWGHPDGAYVCIPPSGGISAGTNPPGGGPGYNTCPVYQINSSGGYDSLGDFRVWNPYTAAVVATLICTVTPDGFGNFSVLAQSCS